jgi:glycosyltransferase involved in cell wall biosynthesis
LMSVKKPQVSIVIPAYNAGPYIAESINSVIEQTFTDWELIVVDDGSTDDTVEQVSPFLSDPRISLHDKANSGPASARNAGINLSKADLIALLDADDYWLPTKLEKQIAIMGKYPEVGVCGTGRTMISPDGDVLCHVKGDGFHGKPFPRLLFAPIADMSMSLIRRKVFDKTGLFDESILMSEDTEFWLRVGRDWCFHSIPEPLVCIRIGHASTSGSWPKRIEYYHGYILPRFLNEQGGRQFVKPWHLWRLSGRLYKNRGDGSSHRLARIGWYLRAIAVYPLNTDVCCALGANMLPSWLWRKMKSLKHQEKSPP